MARAQSAGILQQQQCTLHEPCTCSGAVTGPPCCMWAPRCHRHARVTRVTYSPAGQHMCRAKNTLCACSAEGHGAQPKGQQVAPAVVQRPRLAYNHQDDCPPQAGAATRRQKVAALQPRCSCQRGACKQTARGCVMLASTAGGSRLRDNAPNASWCTASTPQRLSHNAPGWSCEYTGSQANRCTFTRTNNRPSWVEPVPST
jgi:hypothetical protein